MRGLGALILLALLIVPVASAAVKPVVPVFAQARIVKLAPKVPYVPTRVPLGWGFKGYAVDGGAVSVTFARKATGKQIITFRAAAIKPSAKCLRDAADHMQTMGGNRVWVGAAGVTTRVWRCVSTPTGGAVILTAETEENVTEYGLGRLVASGKRIS